MRYSVGELARLAKVTVRTLHHYDRVGLLSASGREGNGYRWYSQADAERLHRILVYRELGFGLPEIGSILEESSADTGGHLRRQQALLRQELERIKLLLTGVEALMSAEQNGHRLTPQEMKEVFGAFESKAHEAEVARRWGDTDEHRQSRARVGGYGKQEWLAIRAEAEQLEASMAEAVREGVAPDSPEGMALAEAHRQHITRWFYDCSVGLHRCLGDMYVSDPRFTTHYETRAAGLSAWLRAAIAANAGRSGDIDA